MEIVILTAVTILILILIGMPVGFSFLVGAFIYFLITGESMGSVARDAFFALNSFALLAIPLYMIAGTLMDISGIAERLIDFSRALLKKIKGGMAAIIPLASMFFGALSGSGTATVAAMSNILIPRLTKLGWDKRYTAALLAASGPLGFMIPPNINAILYGVIANTSIPALFLATVIPGIIWGILYMVINRIIFTKWYHPVGKEPIHKSENLQTNDLSISYDNDIGYFQDVFKTFTAAIPAFVMPLIIFGGIYGGVFTATEAGAVACIYALIAGLFIFKTVKLVDAYKSLIELGVTFSSFMIILPMVIILTRILVLNGVPQAVAEGLTSISANPYIIILLMVLVFFITGFFLDPGVLIFILTPLLLPTAISIGMDPIQFGVILFVSIGVGAITPPMAMNLFIVTRITGIPMQNLIRPLLPFLLFGAIPVLFLVAYIPELSLWLPNWVDSLGN